jgi:pimeloyl-ACP methyl ester carboxylesterase
MPDLRGHGRSTTLAKPFRHNEAAEDILALLDHLQIENCKGLGISGGGNVLLHMAAMQPERIQAMVLVSATPYFPDQGRRIMRGYSQTVPGADPQIQALLASVEAFADSHDDMAFTPPKLATIQARTLIVQGDHDPWYRVALSLEMAQPSRTPACGFCPTAVMDP